MRLPPILLLGFVVLPIIFLLLAGARAKSKLKAKYPPPGKLIDVGG